MTNSLPLGGFEKAYADHVESATVATALHGAGYRTILLGKYLNGYPDTASPTYVPPGWDGSRLPRPDQKGPVPVESVRIDDRRVLGSVDPPKKTDKLWQQWHRFPEEIP